MHIYVQFRPLPGFDEGWIMSYDVVSSSYVMLHYSAVYTMRAIRVAINIIVITILIIFTTNITML